MTKRHWIGLAIAAAFITVLVAAFWPYEPVRPGDQAVPPMIEKESTVAEPVEEPASQ
ncbi:hypothetical protein [Microbaculum marinum]|uniref:Uncharacterized protein n=1 Tax=Microbaculum marinum TaxID=1764581 RepID=A0AAW9RLY9_9HYPH